MYKNVQSLKAMPLVDNRMKTENTKIV